MPQIVRLLPILSALCAGVAAAQAPPSQPLLASPEPAPLEAATPDAPDPSAAIAFTNAGGYLASDVRLLGRIPARDLVIVRAYAEKSGKAGIADAQAEIVGVLASASRFTMVTDAGMTWRYPIPSGQMIDVATRFKMADGEEWTLPEVERSALSQGRPSSTRKAEDHPFAEFLYRGVTPEGLIFLSRLMVFDDQPVLVGELRMRPGSTVFVPLPNGATMIVTAALRPMTDAEKALAARSAYPVVLPRDRMPNQSAPNTPPAEPLRPFVEASPWYAGLGGRLRDALPPIPGVPPPAPPPAALPPPPA